MAKIFIRNQTINNLPKNTYITCESVGKYTYVV